MNNTVTLVGLYALGTVLATGVGALPFFFTKKLSPHWLGIGTSLAGGSMLGAAVWLLQGSVVTNGLEVALGMLGGLLFIQAFEWLMKRYPHLHFSALPHAGARHMFLIIAVMTVHSVAEGIGIGVAFGNGLAFGLVVAIALAIHNVPEGLAISLVLVPRGVSAWGAVWWSIFSSTTQMLAIPAYIFVQHFRPLLPIGLGFAAGAMLWMVWTELVPDAEKGLGKRAAWSVMLASAIAMFVFERYLSFGGLIR